MSEHAQAQAQAHLLLLDGELVLSCRLERRGQQLALPIALPARTSRTTPVQPVTEHE